MSSRKKKGTRTNKGGKKKGNKNTRKDTPIPTTKTIDDYLKDNIFPILSNEYITIKLETCKEGNQKYNYKVSNVNKKAFTQGVPDYNEYSPLTMETLQEGINEFNLKDPNYFIRLMLISGTDGLRIYELKNLMYEKNTNNKEKCGYGTPIYGTPIYEELIPMASDDAISTVHISPVETIQGNAESSVDLPIQNTVIPKPISYEDTVSDFVTRTMNNTDLKSDEKNNMIEDKMLEVVLYLLENIDYTTEDLKNKWFDLLQQFKDIFLFGFYEKDIEYSPDLQNIFSCTHENWPDDPDDQKERLVNVGECVKILQAMKLIERFDTSSKDKFQKLNEIYAIIEDNNLLDITSSNNNLVMQLKNASDLVHASESNAKSELRLINPILQAKLNEVNKCMDVSDTELDEQDFDEESKESEDEEGQDTRSDTGSDTGSDEGQDTWSDTESDTGTEMFGLESKSEPVDDELIEPVEDVNARAETVLAKDDSGIIKRNNENNTRFLTSNSVPNIPIPKINSEVGNKSIVKSPQQNATSYDDENYIKQFKSLDRFIRAAKQKNMNLDSAFSLYNKGKPHSQYEVKDTFSSHWGGKTPIKRTTRSTKQKSNKKTLKTKERKNKSK